MVASDTQAVRLTATVGDRLKTWLLFPLLAFVIWRVAILVLILVLGGNPIDSVDAYDGGWYRWILGNGYGYRPGTDFGQQPTAFFPLLPMITRALMVIVRSEVVAVGVVSVVGGLAGISAVYVAAKVWRDEQTARIAVVLMLVFPTSFYLSMFYTEGVFIAVTVGALLAHRRGAHLLATGLAATAVLVRPTGLLIVLLLVALRIADERRLDRVVVEYLTAGLVLVPFMVVQWLQAGDALAFFGAQTAWGRHTAPPWTAINGHVRLLATPLYGVFRWIALLDLLAVTASIGAAVSAWVNRKVGRGWPPEAWAWTVLILIPAVSTGILTSVSRFVLTAWPVFIVCAYGLKRVRPAWRWAIFGVLGIWSIFILSWFVNGVFVA